MALCGFAHTYTELLVYRFITGIGSAFQMCGAQLYLADVSIRENRARVLGANTSAALLGVSVGPAMGGLMAQHMGSSAPFFVTGSLAALAAVWSMLRLKESHPLFKRSAKNSMESIQMETSVVNGGAHLPGVRGEGVQGNKLGDGALEVSTEFYRIFRNSCFLWEQLFEAFFSDLSSGFLFFYWVGKACRIFAMEGGEEEIKCEIFLCKKQ